MTTTSEPAVIVPPGIVPAADNQEGQDMAEVDRRLVDIRVAVAAVEQTRADIKRIKQELAEAEEVMGQAQERVLDAIVAAKELGASYSQIGAILGVSRQRAHQLWVQATNRPQPSPENDGEG